MNRRKLLSLESKQPNIYHCIVCITIMAKFTNYWHLLCRISYIIPFLFVYYLSDLKLQDYATHYVFSVVLSGLSLSAGSQKIWIYVSCTYWSVTYPFWLYQPSVEWYVSAVRYIAGCTLRVCGILSRHRIPHTHAK